MKKLIFFFFAIPLFAQNSPYLLTKFHNILNVSKLQAPTSKYNPLYSVKYGKFKYYSNKFFYLQDNKYMVFYMCNKKNRSELRIKQDWKVNTKTPISLSAKVKLFSLNAKREFTFLQIHADSNLKNSIDKPLLRIVWMKNFHNLKNHIWVIIKKSPNIYGQNYEKIDLGLTPKDFFYIHIIVKTNKLTIIKNNKKYNFNVSYWKKYYNYFKAGVYLQGNGCAKVLFDQIYIKE